MDSLMDTNGEFPFGHWPIPRPPLAFSYDELKDEMTIEGMKYTGDFFRLMSAQVIINQPIRVLSNSDGAVMIRKIEPKELVGGLDNAKETEI